VLSISAKVSKRSSKVSGRLELLIHAFLAWQQF